MRKAVAGLSVRYPKLTYITCEVHALHRVCKTIPTLYPIEDMLLANGKTIFVKLPARIEFFKNKAPETPLPPNPVIICWGTWLHAIVYCVENF
jgi:hypothetical protein